MSLIFCFDIFFDINSKYHVRICNIGKHKLKFHHAQCGKELEFPFYPSKPHEIFLDHNVLPDKAHRIVRIKTENFFTKNIFQNKATPPPDYISIIRKESTSRPMPGPRQRLRALCRNHGNRSHSVLSWPLICTVFLRYDRTTPSRRRIDIMVDSPCQKYLLISWELPVTVKRAWMSLIQREQKMINPTLTDWIRKLVWKCIYMRLSTREWILFLETVRRRLQWLMHFIIKTPAAFFYSFFSPYMLYKVKKKHPFFHLFSFLYSSAGNCLSKWEKKKKRYFNVSLIFCFYSSMISNCRPRSAIIKHIFKLLKDAGCQDKQQHYNNIIVINFKKKKSEDRLLNWKYTLY